VLRVLACCNIQIQPTAGRPAEQTTRSLTLGSLAAAARRGSQTGRPSGGRTLVEVTSVTVTDSLCVGTESEALPLALAYA